MRDATIYTPDSSLRSPRTLIKAVVSGFWSGREIAWVIFFRDIQARYRQSFLGLVWLLISPFMTASVFIYLHQKDIIRFSVTGVSYPLYVFVGASLWSFFTTSVSTPLNITLQSKGILSKAPIPWETLILASGWHVLFNVVIRSFLILLFLVYFKVELSWGWAGAALTAFFLVLLGMTLGLLLTPYGMIYRDISLGLPFLLTLGFFLTPVAYEASPEYQESLMGVLNPVNHVLNGARELLIKGTLTEAFPLVLVAVLTVLGSIIAVVLYRLSMPILIEKMGTNS